MIAKESCNLKIRNIIHFADFAWTKLSPYPMNISHTCALNHKIYLQFRSICFNLTPNFIVNDI